jgi:hypothetical protein
VLGRRRGMCVGIDGKYRLYGKQRLSGLRGEGSEV